MKWIPNLNQYAAMLMVMVLFNFGWLLEAPILHWKTLAQILYTAMVFWLWDKGNEQPKK